jgi:hypothetical protein
VKHYLDTKSLIESGYYNNNARLIWHIDHLKYDNFCRDLLVWLNEVELKEEEKEIFDVCITSIFTELASYLTHVLDFIHLSESNISPTYSSQSHVFIDKIWNREVVKSSLLIELEKQRFKESKVKLIYSLLIKLIPMRYVQTVVISSNDLSEQYVKQKKGISLKIFPEYYFDINTKSTNFSQSLATQLRDLLVKKIESNYFELNKDHIESIGYIIESYLARSFNNINSYNGLFKGLNKHTQIISGTGHNYYNRLLSSILQTKEIEIVRFNHGGERCFFDDKHFWHNGDLFQTNTYVTYGVKWKKWLERIANKSDNRIVIKSINSHYHKKIYQKFFNKVKQKNNKILYIPNSFVGEFRIMPYVRLIDPLLFDWQKYLIEILQKNGFEVIYKTHPKGFLHNDNFLGEIANFELNSPMIEALEEADIVLCDMAGSAFVESICAGKNIVLIDTLQRPFDISSKIDLMKVANVVNAYWEDNILKINEKELVNSLTNFDINKESMRQVVKDYYLSH